MLKIGQISTAGECAAVKALVLEFVAWAATHDTDAAQASNFANLEAELDGLPGIYGPPSSSFLLANDEDRPVGCVAFRELDAETRRVEADVCQSRSARARHRGQAGGGPDRRGAGAGAQGRRRMELSSYHSMTGAHRIYCALGFRDVPASADLPAQYQGRVVFMEMDL